MRNAGAVFVGPSSPVAAGDYATGGNHVLPTSGWARSVGGLGLETFLKPVTTQRLTAEGLALLRPTVEALAAAEGMPAHAAAVRRMKALAPEFRAYTWAPPNDEVARLAGIDPSQVVRFDQNTPPLPLPVDAARARSPARSRRSAATRRAATSSCGARSPPTTASSPSNVVLGTGADDLILLCARCFAGPGDTIAIPEAPTYPLYRIAAQLAGAEVGDDDPVRHVHLPAEQPRRRAPAAARRAAARLSTRRTSSTAARRRSRCSTTT